MSGLVCPGIGQLLQKRWISGSLFLGSSLAIFVYACWITFAPIIHNFRQLADGSSQLRDIPLVRVFLCLLVLILIYLVNLWDIWNSHKRIKDGIESI